MKIATRHKLIWALAAIVLVIHIFYWTDIEIELPLPAKEVEKEQMIPQLAAIYHTMHRRFGCFDDVTLMHQYPDGHWGFPPQLLNSLKSEIKGAAATIEGAPKNPLRDPRGGKFNLQKLTALDRSFSYDYWGSVETAWRLRKIYDAFAKFFWDRYKNDFNALTLDKIIAARSLTEKDLYDSWGNRFDFKMEAGERNHFWCIYPYLTIFSWGSDRQKGTADDIFRSSIFNDKENLATQQKIEKVYLAFNNYWYSLYKEKFKEIAIQNILDKEYLNKKYLSDAWGQSMRIDVIDQEKATYHCPFTRFNVFYISITSAGPDGQFDTDDDVQVTNRERLIENIVQSPQAKDYLILCLCRPEERNSPLLLRDLEKIKQTFCVMDCIIPAKAQ